MSTKILVGLAVFIALLFAAAIAVGRSQELETSSIVRFQRAADDYAFLHRRIQRTLGEDPGGRAMAAAIRAARPNAADGDIFSEEIAAVLRARIVRSIKKAGCEIAGRSGEVLRPNQDASAAAAMPACVELALPKLPPELEYRIAGVTLLLVDSHANLVVDVVHGAFPVR
jgi:hypothetical protein